MLWLVNRTLHIFGWSICVDIDSNDNITCVYPARVKFRGFSEKSEANGFIGLAKYVEENAKQLREECEL